MSRMLMTVDLKLGYLDEIFQLLFSDQTNEPFLLQKQDAKLQSLVIEENSKIAKKFQKLFDQSISFKSDIQAKVQCLTSQYRDQRSRILHRSARQASECFKHSNSLREKLLAHHKALLQIQRTSGMIRKERLSAMNHRSKTFRALQNAEVSIQSP